MAGDDRRSRGHALVVDFGGVLTTSIGEAFDSFCEREGVALERLREILRASYAVGTDPSSVVADVETGRIDPEHFERRLAALLSEGCPRPVEPEGLLRRMLAGVQLDPAMLEAVGAVHRAGIATALLSNSWGKDLYPRAVLDELFDAVVISADVGLRKPDPAVFRLVADRLGMAPSDCVFVDDVEGNVEAARAVGMRGILHVGAPSTIRELERLFAVGLPGSGWGPSATI